MEGTLTSGKKWAEGTYTENITFDSVSVQSTRISFSTIFNPNRVILNVGGLIGSLSGSTDSVMNITIDSKCNNSESNALTKRLISGNSTEVMIWISDINSTGFTVNGRVTLSGSGRYGRLFNGMVWTAFE